MSEVIQAVFTSGKTFVKTDPQWKYNKGQKLQIFGLDIPEYFEAHFSNEANGVAKKVIGQNGLVNIPSEYFLSGQNIYCWLYIQEGDAHLTKCQIRIPLYEKGAPTDEEPTPEQQSALDQAIETLNTAAAGISEKYTKPDGGIPKSDLNAEVQTSLAASELIASIASNCTVERVTEGTKILGKITGRKLCANVGHYYNAEQDILSLYAVFSLQGIPGNEMRKFYFLFSTAVDEAPVELTPDTAQRTVEVKSDNTNVYAYRPMITNFAVQKSPLDARFLAIAYDGNGNEIDRVYSAQFRYEAVDGAVTRTRFQTTPEAADHIIGIGLIPIDMAVVEKYGKIAKLVNHTLYPMVNTDEGAGYRFIVPDSLFAANPGGLSIATVNGAWDMYRGPNVPQAKDNMLVVTLTPTASDMSGTMDKTVGEIYEAWADGQQIRFRIRIGDGIMEGDCSARWYNDELFYPSFSAFVVEHSIPAIVSIHTDQTNLKDRVAYSVDMYPLTSNN